PRQQLGDVGQRPQGEERDLTRLGLESGGEEVEGTFLDGVFAERGAQGVLELSGELGRLTGVAPRRHGDVAPAGGVEEAAQQGGAGVGVAVDGRYAAEVQLRA